MFEQYKKTFVGTQMVIALLTIAVVARTHRSWLAAAAVFLVMQLGALAGALWASRLRRRMLAMRAKP